MNVFEPYKSLNLQVFVVTHIAGWPVVQANLSDLPWPVKYFDPSDYRGHAFTREIIELNEAAYGKGMAAPAWTFANFGTIGAGITGGLLCDGQPIAKFSIVGNINDPTISHEWTLLVHPDYQGKGIGSLTLALAIQAVRQKRFHTFFTQTDNASLHAYLKVPHPLELLAYGFVHTRPNSLLIKVAIPAEPLKTILGHKPRAVALAEYPIVVDSIPTETAWIGANNHQLWLDLNEALHAGQRFALTGRTVEDGKTYLLVAPHHD